MELTEKQIARFWAKVDKSGECWLWRGATTRQGYGVTRVDEGKRPAHRVAYILVNGPIPPGLLACHHCDNPPCVRPDHIFLGTDADNQADRIAKGRPALKARPVLTDADVERIRTRHATEQGVTRALAQEYNVSRETIRLIVNRQIRTRPLAARAGIRQGVSEITRQGAEQGAVCTGEGTSAKF